MSRGASSQIITVFFTHWAMAPGPQGPNKMRALGPWAQFSELDGDRRGSVCNSVVLGFFLHFRAPKNHVGCIPVHFDTSCGHPKSGSQCSLSAIWRIGGF